MYFFENKRLHPPQWSRDGRSPWGRCHFKALPLVSLTDKLNDHQGNCQNNLGKWKSTFLRPTIPANVITLCISPSNKPPGGKRLSGIIGHRVHLAVEIFLYRGYHLMGHKYLHTLWSFCEVHPHISHHQSCSKSQACWLKSQSLFPTI